MLTSVLRVELVIRFRSPGIYEGVFFQNMALIQKHCRDLMSSIWAVVLLLREITNNSR